MSVPIRVGADKKTLEPGVPVALFATNVGSTATLQYRHHYMVARSGQAFIMQTVVDEGSASPISVILNWKPRR